MAEELTPPPIPKSSLETDGWERTADRSETLFSLPTMQILGRTLQYEDARSRRELSEATGGEIDQTVRFFAVTTVGFDPPLPPGTTPTMFVPTLRSEARRNFVDRLEQRGLTAIEKGRSERLKLSKRKRVRAHKYRAVDPLNGIEGQELPLECWIAIWTTGGTVRIVTSGYPAVSLDTQFDLEPTGEILSRSPRQYREAFFSLLRGVPAAENEAN